MAATARLTAAGRASGARGIALVALLIVVAAMGAALAETGTLWHQVLQREKERELIFIGLQYRRAIRLYYTNSPGGAQAFPPTLAALLRDPRYPGTQRYLRRPYRDPMTNSDQWGLVRAPGGGIMGVYSLAKGTAIKERNFPAELGWRGGRASYGEWQFVYVPPAG